MIEVTGLNLLLKKDRVLLPLLKNINFHLAAGRTLGIIGESGSGKTLIAYALLGLLNRTDGLTGSIELFGTGNILAGNRREVLQTRRQKIGYVPQDPQGSLTPTQRIGAQLREVVEVKTGLSRQRAALQAAELLTRVGFREPQQIMSKYPHQLSGGMCQRVAVAMAIAGAPELIVADEPTSNLDMLSKKEIMALLQQAQTELACTMVIVTHDLEPALQYCDTLAVFYSGQLVEMGAVREGSFNPRHPYTKDLLSCFFHELAGNPLRFVPADPPPLYERLKGCRYAHCCSECRPRCREEEPPTRRFLDGLVLCWLNGGGE
ncbi:MAG: ABC transporter ATP-binding protein [Pelotomaculum sp.]|jgi:oligopeptide/dipeptide ABC transporter ATP-binding protein